MICHLAVLLAFTPNGFTPRPGVLPAMTLRARVVAGAAFNSLSTEEKVAMVRVVDCNGPSEGPLKAPAKKPDWATLTNETWTSVKAEYPELSATSEDVLSAAWNELKTGDVGTGSSPGEGAVPVGIAVVVFLILGVAGKSGGFF